MYNKHQVDAIIGQKIRECFSDAYTVARFNAKKDFKKNERCGNKWSVARALVALNDVAKNPDKYFAPENTYDAWKQRALDYVKNHPEDVEKASSPQYVYDVAFGAIVQQPYTIVFDRIYPVIHDYFGYGDADYMDFCGAVQNYYYHNEFKVSPYEPSILDFAEKMSKRAKIVKQKNPVTRAVMHWLAGNKRQY